MSWHISFKKLSKAAARAFAGTESDKNIGWGYQTEAQKAFALAAIEATPGTHIDGYVAGHNNAGGVSGNLSVVLAGFEVEEVAEKSPEAVPLASSTTSMEDPSALDERDDDDAPLGQQAPVEQSTPVLSGGGGEFDGGGASGDFGDGSDSKPDAAPDSDAGAGESGGATGNE